MIREKIFEASAAYFLEPLQSFLTDHSVTEVMVNSHDQVFIERQGRIEKTDARFESEDALLAAIRNVAQWVGRRIDRQRPILDARLPNGYRVHAIIPPASRSGVCLNIRKFQRGGFTLDQLINLDSLSAAVGEFLEICVRLKKNILISGGTGSGKTSLLGAVAAVIPRDERVIVIEDTSELNLPQEHVVYLEVQRADERGRGALSIRELFVASLRMRPDRILVGEVRGGEALDMMQSMLSGHSGSLSTVHANSAPDALVRLETLSLMSDVDIPVYVARAQVAAAINLVVQLDRFSEDGSRRITRITEVNGLDENDRYRFTDLFAAQMKGKTPQGRLKVVLTPTGHRPSFSAEPYGHGLNHMIDSSEALWSN